MPTPAVLSRTQAPRRYLPSRSSTAGVTSHSITFPPRSTRRRAVPPPSRQAESWAAPLTSVPFTHWITSPLFSPASRAGLGVLPRSELPTTTTPPVVIATPTDWPPGTSRRWGCTDSFTVRSGRSPSSRKVSSPSPLSPAVNARLDPPASVRVSAPAIAPSSPLASARRAADTGITVTVPASSTISSGSRDSTPSCGDSMSIAIAAASAPDSRRLNLSPIAPFLLASHFPPAVRAALPLFSNPSAAPRREPSAILTESRGRYAGKCPARWECLSPRAEARPVGRPTAALAILSCIS